MSEKRCLRGVDCNYFPDFCKIDSCEDCVEDITEYLSDFVHDMWSRWMIHMFDRCQPEGETLKNPCLWNKDGTVTIPKERVDRWVRQMTTKYDDLPEPEKGLDRVEARNIMELMDYWYFD